MYYDMRIIRNIENKNKKWLTGCVLNINKYFFFVPFIAGLIS